MDWITVIAFAGGLLGAGAAAGLLAGLLGVGGGIVIVPVLYQVLTWYEVPESVRMHVAVATSLATIVATSLASARAHRRRGALDPDLLRTVGPGVVAGALVGVAIGGRLGGDALAGLFAVVALMVAANMALSPERLQLAAALPRGWPRPALGAAIGGISVMMGIGGGALTVPALSAFSVPIRRAVGTAAAVGFLIAVPGTLGFVVSGWGLAELPPGNLGYVNAIGVALIAPATVSVAPLGSRLAHSLPPRAVRAVFALFLLATALRLGYGLVT